MYGAAVNVEERLARHDPENAKLLRSLAFSHADLARSLLQATETSKATAELERGRAIISALIVKNPSSDQRQKDLAWFDSQLALSRR